MPAIHLTDRLTRTLPHRPSPYYDQAVTGFGVRITLAIQYLHGRHISAHPDAAPKVATMQIYLPKDHSQLHLGTSFYHRDGEGFHLLKTNPFKPNAVYAFARTDYSWHGVAKMSRNETARDTLALTLYQKGFEYTSRHARR